MTLIDEIHWLCATAQINEWTDIDHRHLYHIMWLI